jgi:hypothetical protein
MDSAPVCSSYRYADGVTTPGPGSSHPDEEQPTTTIRLRDANLSKLMDSMTKEAVTYLEAMGHVKARSSSGGGGARACVRINMDCF